MSINPKMSAMIISIILLTSCSSSSKATPYFEQICADWNTGAYMKGSIRQQNDYFAKFKSQVESAKNVDIEATVELDIGLTIMQNITSLQQQESEAFANSILIGSQVFRDKSIALHTEASSAKGKLGLKMKEFCVPYDK